MKHNRGKDGDKPRRGGRKNQEDGAAPPATGLRYEDVVRDPEVLRDWFRRQRRKASDDPPHEGWAIRTHRALSWYARSWRLLEDGELASEMIEIRFLLLWISLAALAARMDDQRRIPAPESESLRTLISEIQALDTGRALGDFCGVHRTLVRRLLTSPYLDLGFWRDPGAPDHARRLEARGNHVDQARLCDEAENILKQVLSRLFMLRGQIVHGTSTAGGKWNRQTMQDGLKFMQGFVPTCLSLVIEAGPRVSWPPAVYPPTVFPAKDIRKPS